MTFRRLALIVLAAIAAGVILNGYVFDVYREPRSPLAEGLGPLVLLLHQTLPAFAVGLLVRSRGLVLGAITGVGVYFAPALLTLVLPGLFGYGLPSLSFVLLAATVQFVVISAFACEAAVQIAKRALSNQPLHPTPTAAEAPASGAGERRR